MTHQSHPEAALDGAGQQVAQLFEVLALVERIAGRAPSGADGEALDAAARFGGAYADAAPVAQRRFDALAAEATAWAAVGVEALLAAGKLGRQPTAAARRLANELLKALRELGAVVRL